MRFRRYPLCALERRARRAPHTVPPGVWSAVQAERRARCVQARAWRTVRAQVFALDPARRRALLTYWNGERLFPALPNFLAYVLRAYLAGRVVL